jgi:hypothetical protein
MRGIPSPLAPDARPKPERAPAVSLTIGGVDLSAYVETIDLAFDPAPPPTHPITIAVEGWLDAAPAALFADWQRESPPAPRPVRVASGDRERTAVCTLRSYRESFDASDPHRWTARLTAPAYTLR